MRAVPAILIVSAVFLAGTTSAIAADKKSDAGESKEEMALKDRKAAPKDADVDANATLAALLDKRDKGAWSNSKAAKLEGVLVQVEAEEDGDVHLVLAPAGQETDTKHWVIAEVTPAWQKKDAHLKADALRELRGKKVTVTGWLYYEPDAESPDPRGTLWELHPATSVK